MLPLLKRTLLLLVLLLVPVAGLAQGEPTVIGNVGGVRVTTLDAEIYLSQTGGPRPGETLEQARERAANELLAGHVVEQLLARTPQINPQLGAAINRARRQIMLDFYIQTNLERFTPSDEEIDAFIATNPQLFEDRAAYWLNQFLVAFPDGANREALDEALATLRDGALTPERILTFQRALIEADLPFQRQAVWRTSEQLPTAVLQRLEELYNSGQRIDVIEGERQAELLFLLQRVADPADPRAQRPQIAQGLVQQNVVPQRDALIAELAGRARRGEVVEVAAPAPVEEEPVVQRRRPSQPWMFAVVGGLGLMLPLVLWSGKGLTGSLSRRSPWRWPARLGVTAVVLIGLAAAAWVSSRLLPLLGAQSFAALSGGGIVMGALVAATWARSLSLLEPDPGRAAVRFGLLVALQGALFIAYVVFRLGLL